ncbi:chemotaxis protein MotB [Palleronia aestuarii]|uniref:Chemotaxis protein MotB n=1 Tax=Palleronia aestuarii TaxID=568105 RepID=A0A2W7NLD4_9RHOB|nr:flagellar motor protein MotB [Palleronia aestuarii]PZX18917.1 chemotaxis protein MotB [Palleronia aestuarii]
MSLTNKPTIIKRKKVIAGGGHHGGAWKVAYADFVTAMMAFFLLMWLLNATTESQKNGLADYFSPTISVARTSGGGEQVLYGTTALSKDTMSTASATATSPDKSAEAGTPLDLPPPLAEIQDELTAASGESMVSDELLQHIITRVTDEGLIVDLFDLPGAPLFQGQTDRPTPLLVELAGVVSEIFGLARNEIAINGHVRSVPIVLRDTPVWSLSAARAQVVRGLITVEHVAENRIQRIAGYADREQLEPDPMDVRNNRVEIILLR